MSRTATGSFEIKMNPDPPYDVSDGVSLGRVSISKTFAGDLDAQSLVQMLAARGEIADSAGYVAIERVVGSLGGRQGSFVLQHFGVMTRGSGELIVSVVPDTGTGELRGLSGRMTIGIVEGKHQYRFEYDLPANDAKSDF